MYKCEELNDSNHNRCFPTLPHSIYIHLGQLTGVSICLVTVDIEKIHLQLKTHHKVLRQRIKLAVI